MVVVIFITAAIQEFIISHIQKNTCTMSYVEYQISTQLELNGWKRGVIGRECTYSIGKRLAGMLKVSCVGADLRCFQNAEPLIRLRSVRMM